MSRRTICKRMLSEKEISQMLHNLYETDSSDAKFDLSLDAYIPGNESEPTSSDECFTGIAQNDFCSEFENDESSSINIDLQHVTLFKESFSNTIILL
ncbi:hypothetical protein AVEN_132487-1 [Araneus ventricosus]|uniref:Uncharacterized protein n=1 Tax=Araneus ventricosus TaxID=182803 RepID=A0A4Y2G216_ARAVE|nr:hypothetical protein AVEN_132487-1 [Araneus ventricosus]